MRKALVPGLALLSVLALCSSPALAQGAKLPEEVERLAILANMVRWKGLLLSVLVILGARFLVRFIKTVSLQLGEAAAERRMFVHKTSAFLQFAVYVTTFVVVVLMSFEISAQVLLIMGGAAMVAIGFAMKDLASSVVAGVMIMFDRPFQVGDRVSFGGEYGDITAIGLRSVRLQTLDDNTVTIPNNLLLSQVASSGNYGSLDMMVVVDFHIGVDQDVHRARDLIQEATATSNYVHLPKPIVVLVSQVIAENYVAIRLRVKAYVLDTRYEKAFETDVSLRVLEAFDENGIRPPAILHRSLSELAVPDRKSLRLAHQNV